ncbi:unnamed protein product [Phaedon cochleariae]|uniref:NADP-dependent oxidoreductase domain-containing protein n=1 Tax=Phaedon cochleariae TaxID=80249 RepID=A0A9N9X615_PHACE|nr:unnamed protein product [Phaedon cochleariae]
MMSTNLKFRLPTGEIMPLIGFGTWMLRGDKVLTKTLDLALKAGYRLFDTADMYGNEAEIGRALKELLPKHNLSRKDVFIQTKLDPGNQGGRSYKALRQSLYNLDCEYIDLYLIHWPGSYGVADKSPENAALRDDSWQKMVRAVKEGLIRHIGVSNYTIRHLKQLLSNNHGIKPVVNQVEWHPFWHQKDLYEFCKEQGILLQAYQPLGGPGNRDIMDDREVKKIAKKLDKTTAQVILRWSVQQNIAIIPKSQTEEHIYSNIQLDFTIPEEDMKTLFSLEQQKYDWDPETIA